MLDTWLLVWLSQASGLPETLDKSLGERFTLGHIFLAAYIIGLCVMIVRLATAFWGLRKLLKGKTYELAGPAASFFGHILHQKNGKAEEHVLFDAHEQVHVEERHSLDVLFMEFLIAGYWFHPLIYKFRQQLKLVHEFIADAKVVRQTGKPYSYAQLLVRHSQNDHDHYLLSTFASFTKSRLIMLNTIPSPAYRKAKYFFSIPLFITLTSLFSFDLIEELPEPLIQPIEMMTAELDRLGNLETPIIRAEPDRISFVNDTLPNPSSSVRIREDKRTVEPIYIIDGKPVSKEEVELLKPEAIKSIHVLKGKQARASYGENGENGVIEIHLGTPETPIQKDEIIDLLKKDKVIDLNLDIQRSLEYEKSAVFSNTSKVERLSNPLIVIDGEVQGEQLRINEIDPNSIKSIHIFKGEKAINLYGEAGQDGVVVINTKKNSSDGKIVFKVQTEGVGESPSAFKIRTDTIITMETDGMGKKASAFKFIADTINFVSEDWRIDSSTSSMNVQSGAKTAPLLVVNDEILGKDQQTLQDIDINEIVSISVLKNLVATQKYGDAGADGVIVIYLKGYKKPKAAKKEKRKKRNKQRKPAENMPKGHLFQDEWSHSDLGLRVFPTQATEWINIEYKVNDNDAQVNLAVYSNEGRLIKVLKDNQHDKGIHRLQLKRKDVDSAGLYYVRLVINDQMQTMPAIFND